MAADTPISILSADDAKRRIAELAALLHACVHAGANVNFVLPFSHEDSETFWRKKVLSAMRDGTRVLWVAEAGGAIVGSVQLYHRHAAQPAASCQSHKAPRPSRTSAAAASPRR